MAVTIRPGFLLLAALALGSPAAAQDLGETDARWLPWLGCWQPSGAPAGAEPACVLPAGEDVVIRAFADGQLALELPIRADAERREIAREGCTGWESARWSGDAHRVYLASEMVCAGGVRRSSSGIIAMTDAGEWLDIRAVSAAGRPAAIRVERYAPASASAYGAAGVEPRGRELGMAVQTARVAAAARPSANDVIEAVHAVAPEAVEALLVETGATFFPDAALLVKLDEANVPERVIDMMVALSYPERFAVAAGEPRALERDTRRADLLTYRDPWAFDPWRFDPWGYRLDRYSFGYRAGYGYDGSGFGYPGGYWGGSPRIIVIADDDDDDVRGRAVKRRGYTRGGDGASGPPPSVTRSPSTSGGTATGGSSTGRRTAKPRDGGNQ